MKTAKTNLNVLAEFINKITRNYKLYVRSNSVTYYIYRLQKFLSWMSFRKIFTIEYKN